MANLFLRETTCLEQSEVAYHRVFPLISSNFCDNLFP